MQVNAGEQLLGMVTELKLAATLQDFEEMNEEVNSVSKAMKIRCSEVNKQTGEFKLQLAESIGELETHYYNSQWRHPPA